jgi:thioredoxin 1
MVEWNEDQFQAGIHTPGITVVDFWATWCGPCKVLQANLPRVSGFTGTLAKVDVDTNRALVQSLKITSVPTMIAYRDGVEVARITGSPALPKLQEWFDGLQG